MKKLAIICAAAFAAAVMSGCGVEYKDVDNGGSPFPPIPPVPTPTISPTPTPSPTGQVDTSEHKIFSGNLGPVTDVCVNNSGEILYPLTNGTIQIYNRDTESTRSISTGGQKIFSICMYGDVVYYTNRADNTIGHINIDGTGNKRVETDIPTNAVRDPAYIRSNGSAIAGADFGTGTNGGVFYINPAESPDQYTKAAGVEHLYNPFDITYSEGSWLTGNFNATDGYIFMADNQGQWGTVKTKAKYIMSPFINNVVGGTSNFIYSSMAGTGTDIRKVNAQDENDESILTSGEYPYAYKVVPSKVNPSKVYFTSMGNAGNAGVYVMNIDGTNVTKVSESAMYYPAMLVVNDKRTDLPEGYEEIVWTTTGSDIDKTTADFSGGNGAVYTKVVEVNE